MSRFFKQLYDAWNNADTVKQTLMLFAGIFLLFFIGVIVFMIREIFN